jgi:hypothetical protein
MSVQALRRTNLARPTELKEEAMDITSADEGLRVQREYIKKLEDDNFTWDILVGDAFVRGMRDIGYKSTAFALAELIDNSIQAAATQIDVVFGFDAGTKPTQIAVIDDGYGMEPTMVRASLVWGAGTRAENRAGFGKYGYGLPSASVSQCHRVTVYSKTESGTWHSAYLDIDEIKNGSWTKSGRIEMPVEREAELPRFVVDHLKSKNRWGTFTHGTVVIWGGDLDRIDYRQREALRANLVTHLGVIYRNFLVATPMTVDEHTVQPCDPLFLTPGFRYYDLDEDRAIAYDPAVVDVKDKGKVIGQVRVRYSRMPSTFFRKPEMKHTNKPGRGNTNERLEIADANNGIIFMRNGRQIDVVRPPRSIPGAAFNATTDRFWAVEVDFDATLDELFSITTSKQQVKPADSLWDVLKDSAKMFAAIGQMRTAYDKEAKELASKLETSSQAKRASVEAIEAAEKFRTAAPPKPTAERAKEAQTNLDQSATRRAKQSGLEQEAVKRQLEASRQGVDHEVETEDLPGAPFFRCVQEGGTRVLYLNVAHPFYTKLYQGPGSNARLRAGLEVLLWTLGNAEADTDPESDRRTFYEQERVTIWSPHLATSLTNLSGIALGSAEPTDDAA